ncbi:hypothetical protein [Lacticaseibacillus mingshuiensis]|uniref:Uncharacterized protein n=1 Tax=Lacticaseibacillus mingshuiensis TaxID=2799574 RepID=A0ABW4CG98_9LACO|nr:hypothetical protein [Lacticaseibacillus mingshuiensis]
MRLAFLIQGAQAEAQLDFAATIRHMCGRACGIPAIRFSPNLTAQGVAINVRIEPKQNVRSDEGDAAKDK